MNNRGVIGIIMFFIILFAILLGGLFVALLGGIIDYSSETITPIMTDLGVIEYGNATINVSQGAEYGFGTLNKFIQATPWIIGFMLMAAIVFSVIFAASYTFTPSPAYAVIWIAFTLLLIFGSILVSNAYQDLYSSSDVIGSKLKEQSLSSYIIIHSPIILSVVAIITGIYIFTRPRPMYSGYV